ncbi:MAG: lipase maturation factor family protein [Acidobacteriaceae bacterium]|nr:lipase maturation factor family protein [Acidobacteriaceae bacterium]
MSFRELHHRVFESLSKRSSHPLVESLSSRLLGLTYLAAFGSFWPQITGLIGSNGITPAAPSLSAMRSEIGILRAFEFAPSLFWFGISDGLLLWCCRLGCAGALLLTLGIWPRIAAAICWVLYLSLVSIGSPFTNFQWDALLLECGFLALFTGSSWLVWAYRVLLFRLMFESGIIKLLSGDPNWRNLHAIRYHFLTQPLPNPLAYYLYRAPAWLLDSFTASTLVIELVAPFLLFGPRRIRQAGVALLMLLQFTIFLTGNYAFFNFLSLALCLWGLDDDTFRPLAHLLLRGRAMVEAAGSRTARLGRTAASVILAFLIVLGIVQLMGMLSPKVARPFRSSLSSLAPFEIVNSYGLFAVMTTTRPEIIIEGSNDQADWREYSFPYKPGELHRPLPLVAPHQPRLDWQMWFAALGTFPENRWVGNLMYRLLTGDPAVMELLNPPPFTKPPRYMRALLYNYTFTTPQERARTGAVWKRQLRGTWFGPVSLTGQ